MSEEIKHPACFNTPDLDKVETFQKLRKALDDLNSPLNEYCVVFFGFCCGCNQLTAYACVDEIVRCEQCNLSFAENCHGAVLCCYSMSHKKEHYYVYRDTISPALQEQFDRLHSRTNQRTLFELKRRALEEKKEKVFDKISEELNDLYHVRLSLLGINIVWP